MTYRDVHGPITKAAADAEPEHEQLFGPSYDARQQQLRARGLPGGIDRASYRPWRKPEIDRRGTIRVKNNHGHEGVSDRESEARRPGAERKGADRAMGSD